EARPRGAEAHPERGAPGLHEASTRACIEADREGGRGKRAWERGEALRGCRSRGVGASGRAWPRRGLDVVVRWGWDERGRLGRGWIVRARVRGRVVVDRGEADDERGRVEDEVTARDRQRASDRSCAALDRDGDDEVFVFAGDRDVDP